MVIVIVIAIAIAIATAIAIVVVDSGPPTVSFQNIMFVFAA